MKRYFIVCYSANTTMGGVKGDIDFQTNGRYLSSKQARELIKEANTNIIRGSVVLTNIIELSEIDYKDYKA